MSESSTRPASDTAPSHTSFVARARHLPRGFLLFAVSATLCAFAQSAVNAVFNNFVIWTRLGYEYVFLLGALIACVNLFSAARVRVAGQA